VAEPTERDAFGLVHDRLARPFEVVGTLSALVGEPPAAVAQGVGLAMATSREAQVLVDQMHATVRSLATSMHAHSQRCIGELRGPVLWSETMSARASSFGDPDLFICATPSRAYDIDENRVLAHALRLVRDAGRDAVDRSGATAGDPVQRLARDVGAAAGRWLDHPTLSNVTLARPNPRAVRRTRAGKHRSTYLPALDVIERSTEPVGAEEAFRWCRPLVRRRIQLLAGLIDRLERQGRRRVPELRAERGALLAGPIVYHAGRSDGAGTAGVMVGNLLVDVVPDPGTDRSAAEAELTQRAAGRPHLLVVEPSDLDRAIVRAVELTTAATQS
jgi:hypothetical protein